jgi:hypothetical protein
MAAASDDAVVADGVATSDFLYLISAKLEAGEDRLSHHR